MDPILLLCFLTKKENQKNQILLLHDKLIVIYKGKSQVFYRNSILNITFDKKKLIVPLVIGGIGTSLAIIALSMGWYHRQLNLLTIFLFFGIMYHGFIGKYAIEVVEKNHRSVFLIGDSLEGIVHFVQFFRASQTSLSNASKDLIYHMCAPKDWEDQLDSTSYSHASLDAEGFIHASIADQVEETYDRYYSSQESMVLLTIDASKLIPQIKKEWSEDRQQFFPHVYGKINKTAILRLHYFSTTGSNKLKLS